MNDHRMELDTARLYPIEGFSRAPVRRREDGSIDTTGYQDRGRRLRAEALARMLTGLRRRLGQARVAAARPCPG